MTDPINNVSVVARPEGNAAKRSESVVIYPMELAKRQYKAYEQLLKVPAIYGVGQDKLNATMKRIEQLTMLGLQDHNLKRLCHTDAYARQDVIYGMFGNDIQSTNEAKAKMNHGTINFSK